MSDKRYDPKRDLNPHKAAVAAMWLHGARYARQSLGSMGFWDALPEAERSRCRELVARIEAAPAEDVAHV